MNTKATVIVDNNASGELKGEWGLSVFIEYGEKKILLDVGASNLFLKNAEKLGLDIKAVDCAVLSHAHYDHSNGMEAFFKENKKAKFFLQKESAENCYAKRLCFKKYIGLPKHILSNYKDRIELVSGDREILDGVHLVPHKTAGLEEYGKREKMLRKENGKLVPDDFSHEQSLVLETKKGLVIFNSCSHGGAANIITEVKKTFPEKKVYGIIGGFHLYNKTQAEVLALAKAIKETGIEFVCTGHCTKNRAYNILKKELGDSLCQLHVGMVMEV